MDWLLVLDLEKGFVECATLCVKSWVILLDIDLDRKEKRASLWPLLSALTYFNILNHKLNIGDSIRVTLPLKEEKLYVPHMIFLVILRP